MAPSGRESTVEAAVARWGAEAARTAAPADTIGGRTPAVVLEPAGTTMLADMLRWANADKVALVPRGGGTKLAWSRTADTLDAILSTTRLGGGIDHCAGDLTASVPAGGTLAGVNQVLAREGQWLPLDPREADRATIGGIVATNDSGPRRQKHGTPRDLIIGIEMALADGRLAKAGGRVVKNVAGYDLARFLCGSCGTLAVITQAVFKLAPAPPSSRTVVASAANARALADLALALVSGPLAPSAVELQSAPHRLLVRFETTSTAASRQASSALSLCEGRATEVSIVEGDEEATLWRDHEAALSGADGALMRVAVLPSQVGDVLDEVERIAAAGAIECRVAGRAALGVLFVRIGGRQGAPPAPEPATAALGALRRHAVSHGGSAVLVAAAPSLAALVDTWGDVGDALPLMRAVKARFDPNGILNPGRGPGNV